MQTFLPYEDFDETARVLHPRWHLGNQFYREGLTILRGGWASHPVSKMWREYKGYLCGYLCSLYWRLVAQGRDYPHHYEEVIDTMCKLSTEQFERPPWLGDEAFHASHRSNLLRKDRENGWNWYNQFGWTEPDDLPYFWPVK